MISVWGILVGRREIKLSPTRKLEWIVGGLALKHIGDGSSVPAANNDNQEIAA